MSVPDENARIAARLREAADLLRDQGANPFRVNAYRRAADTVAALRGSVHDVLEAQGPEGLEALPGIGHGIAGAIAEMLVTGGWSQLERLQGGIDTARLFQTVPGIGPELARDIHDTLHVDTLEALETACHDGRIGQVPGIGPRRAAAITAALTAMLDKRRALRRAGQAGRPAADGPPVATLLEVDAEYRDKAARGQLPQVAPRRFNPGSDAWLPVLHATRGPWHFTVLFSNTARAHELGRTHDWVVIHFYDDEHAERQHTVVTETRGTLVGKRVVRGRETECRAHYGAG
jgi:hypothetical protein